MSTRHTTTRVLAVLELLQAKGRLSGRELAEHLGVDQRTVRRDIAALEALGIPITAERGTAGGYALMPGFKLPPLVFTPDEALVLALGLTAVRDYELLDAPEAVAGAQAKLERVMPGEMRKRLEAVTASVALARFRRTTVPSPAPPCLSTLSASAHERLGVRLRYRNASDEASQRAVDPYGVACLRGTWYLVAFCHSREAVRTFRMDRIEDVTVESRPFQRPGDFDVLAHLTTSIATLPRAHTIEVRLETTIDVASGSLFPELGTLEERPNGVLLRSQADDLDWFARELARLPWPFEILRPTLLVEAVHRQVDVVTRWLPSRTDSPTRPP